MKACDKCKKLETQGEVKIVNINFTTPDSKKAGKNRVIKDIPIDLCDKCITEVLHDVGNFLLKMKKQND